MKPYHTFKNIPHATPTLAEAMERFSRTGQFILSTDNPQAYEYEDTRPESLNLDNVSEFKVDAFARAANGDNSQVKTVPASPASPAEPAAPASPAATE